VVFGEVKGTSRNEEAQIDKEPNKLVFEVRNEEQD
jgi:hypothetical protein